MNRCIVNCRLENQQLGISQLLKEQKWYPQTTNPAQGIELVHLIELPFALYLMIRMKDTCMNLPMVGYHLLKQPTSIRYHCFRTFWSLCNFSVFDPNGHQLSNRPSVSHQLLFTGKSLAISINLVPHCLKCTICSNRCQDHQRQKCHITVRTQNSTLNCKWW